jgi:DNA polymerase-1
MRQTIKTLPQLQHLLTQHRNQSFAFDVETSGLKFKKDKLLGLALYFETGDSYYIVLQHTMPLWQGHYLETFIDLEEFAFYVAPLFAQDVTMMAHNAKFDMHFLSRAGIKVQGRLADTLLAAHMLDENRSNDLKSLAQTILNMEHASYKTLVSYDGFKADQILGAKLEDVAQYAMNDVEATYRLYQEFMPQLAQQSHRGVSLLHVYNTLWMPLLVVLQQMEERGIALDLEHVSLIREEYVKIAEESVKSVKRAGLQMLATKYKPADIPPLYLKIATEEDLEYSYENLEGQICVEEEGVELPIVTYDMLGKSKTFRPRKVVFNPNSDDQIHELIFNYADIRIPDEVQLNVKDDDEYSADKDNLEAIVYYNGNKTPPFLRDLLTLRKASKFINTYLNRFLEDADVENYNVIHTSFNMAANEGGKGGTRTGRLSSSGPNLTNIPSRGEVGRQSRKMFVARPQHKLLIADLGQAELRMLAHYSLDHELCTAFEEGRDLHIVTGAAFARMGYDELLQMYESGDAKAKEYRALGKTGNFALNYGMGPYKFQRRLLIDNQYEISLDEAKAFIREYNERYAGASAWKREVILSVRNLGYVATILKRRRRPKDLRHEDRNLRAYSERQAVNAIIQGSVSDILCEAMIPIQRALLGLNGSLLLQVHDELVAEVPEENAELGKMIMEDYMVRCNSYLRVPQVASCSIANTWAEK